MGLIPSIPTHTTWDTEHRCWAVPPVAAIVLACAIQTGGDRGSPYGLDGLPIVLGIAGLLWLAELVWDWPEDGQWIVLRLLGATLLFSFHLGLGSTQPWSPTLTGSPWHAALLVSFLNAAYLLRRYGKRWGNWGTPGEDDVWWRALLIVAWLISWRAGDYLFTRASFAIGAPEEMVRALWAISIGAGVWDWLVRSLTARVRNLAYVAGAHIPLLLALGCRA